MARCSEIFQSPSEEELALFDAPLVEIGDSISE
jgi:hypothetical protein